MFRYEFEISLFLFSDCLPSVDSFIEIVQQSKSPDLKTNVSGQKMLKTIDKSSEWIVFLLIHVSEIDNPEALQILLGLVRNWILSSWKNIPTDYYEDIKNSIFFIIPKLEWYTDPSYLIFTTYIQTYAVCRFYPEFWPNFWIDILNSWKPEHILQFLKCFSHTCDQTCNNVYQPSLNVLPSMIEDGSQGAILNFIIQGIGKYQQAFEVFISVAKWVDMSYLLSSDFLINVLNYMHSDDLSLVGASFEILTYILKRNMTFDQKADIISSINLSDHLYQVPIESLDSSQITNLANLMKVALESFLDFSNSEQYHDLIMKVYLIPNLQSTAILHSLVMHISGHNVCFAQQLLEKLIAKVSSIITNSSIDNGDLLEYSFRALNSLSSELNLSMPDLMLSLVSSCQSISDYATILYALNELTNKLEIDKLKEFAITFSGLLDLDDATNSWYVAIGSYSKLILPSIHVIFEDNPDFVLKLFFACATADLRAIQENTDSNTLSNLENSIIVICGHFSKDIALIPNSYDVVNHFINSTRLILLQSASMIISRYQPDDRISIYSDCISSIFPQIIDVSVEAIMPFIKEMNFKDCEQLLFDFIAFISSAIKEILQKISAAELANALLSSIGIHAFQFLDTYISSGSISVLSAVAEHWMIFTQDLDQQQTEILLTITNSILSHQNLSMRTSKYHTYDDIVIDSFLNNSSSFILNLSQKICDIDPELFVPLLEFMVLSINGESLHNANLENAFIYILERLQTPEIIQLILPKFNLFIKTLSSLFPCGIICSDKKNHIFEVECMLKFINIFMHSVTLDPDFTLSYIEQVFTNLGIKPETTECFKSVLIGEFSINSFFSDILHIRLTQLDIKDENTE